MHASKQHMPRSLFSKLVYESLFTPCAEDCTHGLKYVLTLEAVMYDFAKNGQFFLHQVDKFTLLLSYFKTVSGLALVLWVLVGVCTSAASDEEGPGRLGQPMSRRSNKPAKIQTPKSPDSCRETLAT
eukprot:6069297-Amphidinium_carterae.1